MPNSYRQDVERFTWNAFEPRAALLPLPAIAIALVAGVVAGHPAAAMVAAGGAQTAGFGAFQKPLWFRAGPMVLATVGMAISATVGCLLSTHLTALVLAGMFWAFCYGMAGAISSPAQWVGQQCCTFLVVSSAFASSVDEAMLRGAGVLAGGLLQSMLVEVLWRLAPNEASAASRDQTQPDGWRVRALKENLTIRSSVFRYSIRLSGIALVSVLTYRYLHFANAYWIPMTALILPKPDMHTTLERGIGRIAGTIVGAGLATSLAFLVRSHVSVLIVLVVLFMWAAYSLQNVNYAAYVVVLTCYIAFDLAIGKQPEGTTAWHRILATAIGGAIGVVAYLVHIRVMKGQALPEKER